MRYVDNETTVPQVRVRSLDANLGISGGKSNSDSRRDPSTPLRAGSRRYLWSDGRPRPSYHDAKS